MSDTFSYENLIAADGQKRLVNRPGTVRVYESFIRGQIVGRLTSTGKWQTLAFSALAGFSEVGIASEAVDTTAGTELASTFYVEGEFLESGVTFEYGNTADDWRETLAGYGIYLRKSLATTGQE